MPSILDNIRNALAPRRPPNPQPQPVQHALLPKERGGPSQLVGSKPGVDPQKLALTPNLVNGR